MRLRLDPASSGSARRADPSLGDTAGACTAANAGPIAAETTWTAWHTDGAWHRALYVSEWPRLDVRPGG